MINKLKDIFRNWRKHTANYIGGLGYYLLFLTGVFWIIRLVITASQYVIMSPQPAMEGTVITAESIVRHPGIFELLMISILAVFMACLTIAILLLIPYVVGFLYSKVVRGLIDMTGSEISVSSLMQYKLGLSLIMIAIVLVTIYNYDVNATGNWYALSLVVISSMSMILFAVQKLLVSVWKIDIKDVF